MSTKTIPLAPIRWPLARILLFVAVLSAGAGSAWAQGELFVANSNVGVEVYARTADGNTAPVRTIAGAATCFNGVTGIAPDTVHNELFVSICSSPSVSVFALTANGDVAPSRKISGAATGLSCPGDVAVDTVNDEIAVVDELNNTVLTFARTANGNVAPLRVIQLTGTLSGAVMLALDTVNNEVAVTGSGSNAVA